MIGPEATNSLASADVLVVLLGGVVAASAVAALSAGAAGELLQAALTIISRTIGAILNMTLMEASFYFLTISSPSEPIPKLAPNPYSRPAKHHHAGWTPTG